MKQWNGDIESKEKTGEITIICIKRKAEKIIIIIKYIFLIIMDFLKRKKKLC